MAVLAFAIVIVGMRLLPSDDADPVAIPANPPSPTISSGDVTVDSHTAGVPAQGSRNLPATAPQSETGTSPVRNNETSLATSTSATQPAVTGHYDVLNSYADNFIGELQITNNSQTSQTWTATLVFGGNVGELRTSWLESLPQPALGRAGRTYTWQAIQPLAPGTTASLRFQFDRVGADTPPARCVVNEIFCS